MERVCICASYDFEPFYSPWDKEHKELHHSYECDAYNDGRKAGIKEVVDWIEEHKRSDGVFKSWASLQAKLKEWGY